MALGGESVTALFAAYEVVVVERPQVAVEGGASRELDTVPAALAVMEDDHLALPEGAPVWRFFVLVGHAARSPP